MFGSTSRGLSPGKIQFGFSVCIDLGTVNFQLRLLDNRPADKFYVLASCHPPREAQLVASGVRAFVVVDLHGAHLGIQESNTHKATPPRSAAAPIQMASPTRPSWPAP